MKISGGRRSATAWSVLLLVGFILPVISVSEANAAPNSYLVSAARDSEPVGATGETFFSSDVIVDTTADGNVTVAGSPDGRASFWVDDILEIDVMHADGTSSTISVDDSKGCTATSVLTSAPLSLDRALRYGRNRLHFIFRDACGGNDGNSAIYLTGNATFLPGSPRPLPNLDGGTFLAIWQGAAVGAFEECTNSFNVIAPTGIRYTLLAKHCIDGDGKSDNQRTNVNVAAHQPMNITTDFTKLPGSATTQTNTLRIGTAIDCVPPSSPITPPRSAPIVVPPFFDCILPSDNPRPENGDMAAFEPSVPTVLSYRVQTAAGVLPVIQEESMAAAVRSGSPLCHWGAGSSRNLRATEHCGSLVSSGPNAAGEYFIKATGIGGDSGGPVYAYKYDRRNHPVGVYAVGMVLSAGQVCDRVGLGCHDEVGFIPLDTVLPELGVTLLTQGG